MDKMKIIFRPEDSGPNLQKQLP